MTLPRAWGHAGCADQPFAETFAEFLNGGFKVREVSPYQPATYFLFPDGRRVTLDPALEASVRRLADRMIQVPDHPSLYAPTSWRELFKAPFLALGDKFNHLFSRRFVFEMIGISTDVFYRFGATAATFVVALETLDHTVNVTNIPFCKAIYGTCALFATEVQEGWHLATKPFPGGSGFDDRIKLWVRSKRDRFHLWRATQKMYREGEPLELNQMARNRARRDLTAAASTFYGGMFRPGLLRQALVKPICDNGAPVHRGLRRSSQKSKLFCATGAVPEFAGFSDEVTSIGDRVVLTEQYLAFTRAIFAQAELAAGDLALADDGLDWAAWRKELKQSLGAPQRGEWPDLARFGQLLKSPWSAYRRGLRESMANLPGYAALRRDLARMKKSFDLYTYALRLRAFDEGPRSEVEAAIDRDFARNFSTFLTDYTARIGEVTAARTRPLHPVRAVFGQVKSAGAKALRWITRQPLDPASLPQPTVRERASRDSLRQLRHWLRTNELCADRLTDVPETN